MQWARELDTARIENRIEQRTGQDGMGWERIIWTYFHTKKYPLHSLDLELNSISLSILWRVKSSVQI